MRTSQEINELAAALSQAQRQLKAAEMDATNPFYKSKYATLNSVWAACREPLTAAGLSITQMTHETKRGTKLETLLMHTSGQWISSELKLRPKDDTPQAIGSALTYARRYLLASMVGISFVEDDDAEQATNHKPNKKLTELTKTEFSARADHELGIGPFTILYALEQAELMNGDGYDHTKAEDYWQVLEETGVKIQGFANKVAKEIAFYKDAKHVINTMRQLGIIYSQDDEPAHKEQLDKFAREEAKQLELEGSQ